jgi:electron transport complex protein RnfG
MAKKESSFINMVLTLFIVTGVAALALGGIYSVTKEPIALAKRLKVERAISVVVPGFDVITKEYTMLPEGGKDSITFFIAEKEGGELVGTAIKTYTDLGFSGRIWIMVGFNPEGKINNTAVLEHKETPGLGDKMDISKAKWSEQFRDQDPASYKLTVTKDGGDVDAITAATITSRAFCDAVQRAVDNLDESK